LCVHL